MNILCTGSCGHIGTNIVNEAIKRGHTVVGMDNLHREAVVDNLHWLQKTHGDKFQFVWGDIRNRDDFERLPKVDAVIHMAGQCGVPWSTMWPQYDFETNAYGTLNALEFARKCGNIPFVYASTNKTFSDIINSIPTEELEKRYQWESFIGGIDSNVGETENWISYGGGIDFEKSESGTHDWRPSAINQNFPISGFGKYGHSLYGISKLTGDLYVQEYHCQYGLPTAINKMSCIYGLFQKGVVEQGWVSWFINRLQHGDRKITYYGTGKQVRDVLDARDVARLYVDEVEDLSGEKKCDGEIFTVGGGPENTKSLIEAVEEIEKQLGVKAIISYENKRPADQDIYISSLKRVTEVLGWKPEIKFEQTVADMIEENR